MARIPIDPLTGVDPAKAEEIVPAGRIPAEAAEQAAVLAERLWAVFADEDATLVEVNPMALTEPGRRARRGRQGQPGRQRGLPAARPRRSSRTQRRPTRSRRRAKAKHLNYVKLDGQVGIIGNGAGLVMSTLDVVAWPASSSAASGRRTSWTSAAARRPR